MGISFVRFNRRENLHSLAMFNCKEIAHPGGLKIAWILRVSGKNRRPPDYSSNLCPPKIMIYMTFSGGVFGLLYKK